ncbi:thiamine diphosphokinase [Deinococcus yavapaiensis]|uniref:Thiamine diphosphokinase n=1 Tax=Deinococcus yavapaiensis KR-236 TaxID=694435 RepID=A0A318S732_9DEIO|nr:thiamine diphosphokinase [Deinococcus yavapaiensis]PYE52849.1 thiamine pyrophosphokinase [Deinococcus yavapaiensis KR-236]
MNAWILVGGTLTDTPELRRRRETPPALVIAADGGVRHASLLQVEPTLWVGDFDSSDGLDVRNVERVTVPRDKNFTDAELALHHAREAGATHVTFWGAFGGRLDHTLALVLLALRSAEEGLDVELHSGDESAVPLLARVDVRAVLGQIVSIVAVDDLAGLTLRGVRWPLTDAHVKRGSGHTVSNEASDRVVTATLTRGRALLTQRWS